MEIDIEEYDWIEHSKDCLHRTMRKDCTLALKTPLLTAKQMRGSQCCRVICEALGLYTSTVERIEQKGW